MMTQSQSCSYLSSQWHREHRPSIFRFRANYAKRIAYKRAKLNALQTKKMVKIHQKNVRKKYDHFVKTLIIARYLAQTLDRPCWSAKSYAIHYLGLCLHRPCWSAKSYAIHYLGLCLHGPCWSAKSYAIHYLGLCLHRPCRSAKSYAIHYLGLCLHLANSLLQKAR